MSTSHFAATRPSRRALACALALVLLPLAAAAADHDTADDDPQVITLGRVQVLGTRDAADTERAQTPGAVSLVDGETLYQRAVDNLADTLRYVPGVWAVSGSGGDALFITSRGSNLDATDYDNNGVKLFQDGLPVTTADGNNHNRFPDPMTARRIVVAHGANALTYGASTLGGAIDFQSATARDGNAGQIFLEGGSAGTFNARASVGGVSDALDGMLTVEGRQRDGWREHSRQERWGVYANAGWQASENLDLRVFASHVDNRQELPGALTLAQFNADPSQANPSAVSGNFQLNVRTRRLAAKGEWRIDERSRLEFGLSWETQNLYHPIVDKVMVDFDGPGPMPPVEVFSLLINSDQRTLAGMLRYSVQIGNHDVLAGINLADTHLEGGNYRNDGGHRNGLTDALDYRSRSAELFLVDRWKIDADWTLVYGAQGVLTRRDVRSLKVATGVLSNPKADYASFNPRLGVIRALGSGNEAYASISRLYEAPTTFELQDDVRGGNATLDAMHGGVVEVGLRGSRAASADVVGWRWEASLYYARIRDEILSIDDPAAPGTSLSANVPRTVHAGLEALIGASIPFAGGAHRIEPLVSVTWNAFSFDDDPVYGDNRLPAAPRYALRGELLYRNDAGFFFGPTFDVVGPRYADFGNTYRIGAYGLIGLRVGMSGERWDVFAELRNLADRRYVGTLSVRDYAGVGDAILQPGAPRTLSLGLRMRF